jgi:Glycosyl transferase family 2
MVALTIGMPTYNDFDGVYFTIQALRWYQDLDDIELLVVDNYGCEHTKAFVEGWAKGRYILATEAVGTAAAKNRVFAEASGEDVLCCDAHVLFIPGVIARLKEYYRGHPDSRDLLQGPLLADDLHTILTHQAPVWSDEMWGTWAADPRGLDPEGEPFEIPMQGMGVFSCRKAAWLGFNPAFRGFGGEEGYIHEKFRQAGARCLCLPWLRWVHRFPRPAGVPYPALLHDKVKNYIIGHTELGLDLEPVRSHFSHRLSGEQFAALEVEALALSPAQMSGAVSPAAPALISLSAGVTPAMVEGDSVAEVAGSPSMEAGQAATGRRAIVCFVEDQGPLIQQLLALRLSWLNTNSPDTDLVVMGPKKVLARLPDDLIKIPQRPAADDPVWGGYRYINAFAGLNGAGAEQLDRYSHLLRTDVDTFLTPAWNAFSPTAFTVGIGGYAHDEDVQQRIREIATEYGLNYHGMTNIGSTWYGSTAVVRRAAAFAELLTKHLLRDHFRDDEGQWPGWYRGVALKYAGEIAVNHCAPDAQRSELLDAHSTSDEPITHYPHIHCWHTDQLFSKHRFMGNGYSRKDIPDSDVSIVKHYCLAMSLLSLEEFTPVP